MYQYAAWGQSQGHLYTVEKQFVIGNSFVQSEKSEQQF